MGQKVNPQGIRIGITSDWKSRWFSKKDFASQLKEDIKIRELIFKQLKNAAVGGVEVERSVGSVKSDHQNRSSGNHHWPGRNGRGRYQKN